jgi:hypothetical protein
MIEKSPDDPTPRVYLARTYWLQELVSKQELSIDRFAASDFFVENPKYRPKVSAAVETQFYDTNSQAIDACRKRLEANPKDRTALYLLGVAYQNQASFEASLKRSWWASFRSGTKTYKYHSELLHQDPKLYDAYISTGTFHYIVGKLGWNVKWLAYLLGYSGGKDRGIGELRQAAEKGRLMSDDARVLLTLIYVRERNLQAAFDELSVLLKKYPKNYLVHLDMGGIALLMGRTQAAVTIYEDILRRVENRQHAYERLEVTRVYNRLGVSLRQQGGLQAAASWFQKALAHGQRTPLSDVVAHLELGKTYDRMGRADQAREHYQAVLGLEDFAGSHEEAAEFMNQPFRGE